MVSDGGGTQVIPADSGTLGMFRPFAVPEPGGRVSGPESYYDYFINNIPDPDEAFRLEPRIREIVRMHPDVQSAMLKRRKTVASMPDRFDANPAAKDQKVAKEIADAVTAVWRRIPNIQHLYWQMQSAVMDGGIGVEWQWHREATGHIRPAHWFPIHKSRVVFDRLGNFALRTRETPVWGSYVQLSQEASELAKGGLLPDSKLPRGKFMYHVHKMEPGQWERPDLEGYMYYGLGEDVSLYYVVTFDVFVLQKRMKLIEKYSDPPTDIYYAITQGYQEANRKIASSLRGESTVFIPKAAGKDGKNQYYEVEQRAVPTASFDVHEKFNDGYAKRRIDGILLGDADETQKTETGAYSDKVARQDAGPQIWYRWDAGNISGTINAQLTPSLARGLFPNLPDDYLPVLKLEPKEEKDRGQELEIIEKTTALVPVSKSYIYKASGIPTPANGEETVGGQQQAAPGMGGVPPGMPGSPGVPGQSGMEAAGAGGPAGANPSQPAQAAAAAAGRPRPPGAKNGRGGTAGQPRTPIGGGMLAGRSSIAHGGNGATARRTFPRDQG